MGREKTLCLLTRVYIICRTKPDRVKRTFRIRMLCCMWSIVERKFYLSQDATVPRRRFEGERNYGELVYQIENYYNKVSAN